MGSDGWVGGRWLAYGTDGWIGGGWVDLAALVGGWVGCCYLEHSQQWRYIAILLKFSSTYPKDTLQQWRYKEKI